MKALVVGASAGLGRSLCESLAKAGHSLLIIASDSRDLEALAHDLELRFSIEVRICAMRVSPDTEWFELFKSSVDSFGTPDAALFPIGLSSPQDDGNLEEAQVRLLADSNFLGVAQMVSLLMPRLLERGSGTVVGFGSVAAVRGRAANVIYAASKRALQSFFESMRHRAALTRVRVQFYQLGYLDTEQSFGKQLLFPKRNPRDLSVKVVSRLGKDFGEAYDPPFWAVIAAIVRALPWIVFKRLKF